MIGRGEILLSASDGQQFGMQRNRARGICLRGAAGFIRDHENLSLQKRTFLTDAHDFETLSPLGDEVKPPIGILFDDRDDFGSASYVGQTLLESAHNAEDAM